jgi:hypothetical protein
VRFTQKSIVYCLSIVPSVDTCYLVTHHTSYASATPLISQFIVTWFCKSYLQATSHWEIFFNKEFSTLIPIHAYPPCFSCLYQLKGVIPFDFGIFPEQTGEIQPCTGPARL